MSYEIIRTVSRGTGSGVASNGRQYPVNSRQAGTASDARARRMANGVSGYGNLAGYEGLGFSLTSLIQPITSFIPGGSYINAGINLATGGSSSAASVITAPWQVGLPGPGDVKDSTRIAYAKRDHDLALGGDATAYANLKSQASGSATAVGKAWYNAALNDVNNLRGVAAAAAVASPTVAPGVTPSAAPNTDTSAPRPQQPPPKTSGVSPILLLGLAGVAVIALRRR